MSATSYFFGYLDRIKCAGIVYHGSNKRLEHIIPSTLHGDPDLPDPVVFAATDPKFAITYTAKWDDRDIEQSTKDGRVVLQEMYPGALQRIYKDKTGYLHYLPSDTFSDKASRRLSKNELISTQSVTSSKTDKIDNILEYMRSAPDKFTLLEYTPDAFNSALDRRIARANDMTKDSRKQYLRWLFSKSI